MRLILLSCHKKLKYFLIPLLIERKPKIQVILLLVLDSMPGNAARDVHQAHAYHRPLSISTSLSLLQTNPRTP